jgi:hypothetical protein
MIRMVKATLPCGERFFIDEEEWGLSEDDNPSYFVNPSPRCELCQLTDKDYDGVRVICPGVVEHIEMTDEEIAETLIPVMDYLINEEDDEADDGED